MSGYSWIVWDLLAAAALYYFVNSGARSGFTRALVSFFGYSLSIFAANALAPRVARLLYDNVVRDMLYSAIGSRVDALAESGTASAGEALASMPGFLGALMEKHGGELLQLLEEAVGGDLVDTVIDQALENPVLSLIRSAAFLIVFMVFCWVVRRVSRMAQGVYKIPVVGRLNTLLGGLLGLLQGVLFLYISGFLVRIAILAGGGGWGFLNEEVLGNTFIYRVFYDIST